MICSSRDVPSLDEVLDDGSVVANGVDVGALGDDREVIEQTRIPAVVHEPAGHRDGPAQHRSKREHAARRVVPEHLGHHPRVERLVPRFVAGNDAADPGEVRVTVPGGDPPDVAV